MKIHKILPLICFGYIACTMADDYQDQLESCLNTKQPLSANDNAMIWYKTSAERTAIFRQTFDTAYDHINRSIKTNKYSPNTWGVVIGLDNTILDTSDYKLAQYLGCTADNGSDFLSYATRNTLPTLPEAADFSCSVQALGGKVIIVTNRDATSEDARDIINSTESNLATEKVCYDSVIFANGISDTNKNPRFNSITSGDYENTIATTKYTIPLNIVAYVGSDIEDFPSLKQQILRTQSENESDFDKFGTEYFLLPNPISGSWRTNYWK